MNNAQRAALRLDIAARLYAVPRTAEEAGWTMQDAIKAADDMIRANDNFDAASAIVPEEVRDLILTLAREVFVYDFTPMVIRDITRALYQAAGIARAELLEDDPEDAEE